MASKLLARDPATSTVIRDVAPTIATLSVPFYRFGRLYIGGRATVAKLNSGSLAVVSPIPLTTDVKSKLKEMGGNVKYLIAPDMEHHIQLGPWHKEFPNALIIGPEGLAEKRDKQGDDKVPFAVILTEESRKTGIKISDEFDAEFDVEYFATHANKEIALNKRDEKTLIQADLFFNLGKVGAKEQFSKSGQDPRSGGFLSNLFLDIQSLDGDAMSQQRFLWHLASRSNRAAFSESAKNVDKWDFDRVIPCHGDVIETGGKAQYEKVMRWFLDY